jgi:hypothetical protein
MAHTAEEAVKNVEDLLKRAKLSIEAGEDRWRQAAEDIAAASELGATQRKIAETVGKSAAWVNGLLKWRVGGYRATPFGPQIKVRREAAATFSQTKRTGTAPRPASPREAKETTAAEAEANKAKAEAETAKARAQQAKAEAVEAKAKAAKAKADANAARAEASAEMFSSIFGTSKKKEIHSSTRTLLVKALGMLGASQQGERDAAVATVEKLRKKLDMGWDDLIIKATEVAQRESKPDMAAA